MPVSKRVRNIREEFFRTFGFKPHGNNKEFKKLKGNRVLNTPKERLDFLKESTGEKKSEIAIDKIQNIFRKSAIKKFGESFRKYKTERKRFKGSIGVSVLIHKTEEKTNSDWNNSDKFRYKVGSEEFVSRYTLDDETISIYREYHSIGFDERLFTKGQIQVMVNIKAEDLKEKIFKRNYVYKVEIETITKNINLVPKVIAPLSDKRLKRSGSLNIDNFDNQEWDTNTNKCVYDYIIHRYGNVNGFKKSCNYEKLEEIFDNGNSLMEGVNTWGIRNFCRHFGVYMHALDEEEHRFMHYVPYKVKHKDYPSMIYMIRNGHFYPIPKDRIKSVLAINQIIDATSLMTYDIKSIKEKGKVNEKDIIILENTNPLDEISKIINTENKLPNKNIFAKDGIVQTFGFGDKTYSLNNNILLCKYICENMGIDYTGQKLPNILKLIIDDCGGLKTSEHNPHTFDTLLKAKSNRNHYGLIGEDCKDLMKDGYARDINKCYTSIMYNPKNEWIRYDFNDCWEQYDGKLKTGLYYIKTDDTTLFKKSDIYSNTIIEKAMTTNIEFKIKYQLIPSNTEKKNKFKIIIDRILEYTNNDKSVYKLLINMLSGLLAKTRVSSGKYSINNDLSQIFAFIHKYPDMNLHIHKVPETEYYLYGAEKELTLTENNIGMYIQILDQANIKLYDMIDQMGGKLICRNVDCAVVYYKNNKPKLVNSKKWGENDVCKVPQITKVEDFVNKDYKFLIDDWNDHDIRDSDDWEKIRDILVNEGGLLLQGSAGNGKTYVAKKIASVLDNVSKLAPTNKASLNLKGSTIHKFLNLDIDGNMSTKRLNTIKKTIDYIIIDEISMISKDMWNKLVFVKQATGVRFLLLGDDKQLPPVECENIKDYFNHPGVKYLCNNNRNILQVVKRYNLELKKVLDNIDIIDICNFPFRDNKINIAYTNKTCKMVNTKWNELLKTENSLFIPHNGDEKSLDMWIYKDLPIICKKNDSKGGQYLNNETFIVDDYDDKNIYISNERINEENEVYTNHMVVKIEDVMDLFYLNYCTTIHKIQGTTIKEKFTIWDWDNKYMDKKARYTALSRGVCLENISIVG